MREVNIAVNKIEQDDGVPKKNSRKAISITANIDRQPEFAKTLAFYRDAKIMTPLMMFFLDELISSEKSVEEIALNYDLAVEEIIEKLI